MRLLILFTILFTVVSILKAEIINIDSPKEVDKSAVCARELQKILFKPKSCAFNYLNELALKFRTGAQTILFNNQADSFIYSFEVAYKLIIRLTDPFGYVTTYFPNGTKSVTSPAGVYPDLAQSYLRFPGFIRNTKYRRFFYEFSMFSVDAQYYAISFSMSLDDDPIFC